MRSYKISHLSWWIFGIIGAIIGFASSDEKNIGTMLFIWISNGLFWGWILGLILDTFLNSNTFKNSSDMIHIIKDNRKDAKATKKSILEFQDAKNKFQYLSSETLMEKYKTYIEGKESDLICLALEEELVKRGILKFSPMHEKLEKIKEHI